MATVCGPRAEVAPSPDDVVIYPWVCPVCDGDGQAAGLPTCPECGGRGALTAEIGRIWADAGAELRPTPTPPAVMGKACGSCAFRPGAPEEDAQPPLDKAFFCHTGMPVVDGSYAPVAWAKGMPLGAMVCAGWWAAVNDRRLPDAPYRPARDGWGEHA
ncbi:hypothetical protein [Sphaerisporangium sp. NPDC051011]|uniref:hypothetical protein n=1 Tax=Sphaerisporangium sp. NPDC051011 TaxID=3155792 RepID=UPI0033D60DC0